MKSKSWCSPGQLVMLMLAGWINRHQQAQYLRDLVVRLAKENTDWGYLGGLLNYYYREAA